MSSKVHVNWPTFPQTQPPPQNSPEELAPFLLSLTRREEKFSLCLFLSAASRKLFCSHHSAKLPLLKDLTIHLLLLSVAGILFHLNFSNLPSISLYHISECDRGDFNIHVHLTSWCWKTLQRADCYEYLSASSATWPLWQNLEPKQQSKWPHLQNPKLKDFLSANHDHLTSFLLDLPYLYLPLWWNNINWVPYK